MVMTNYRKLLIERARKAREAAPMQPEKPLNHIQQKNHKNVLAWRERMFVHNMTKAGDDE